MKFLICFIFLTFLFSRDEVCLPKEDFDFLANELRQLEVSDSLKTIEIDKLNILLNNYIDLSIQDSLLLTQKDSLIWVLDQKYDLCDERLKKVEPKFLDNKYLWFIMGFFLKEGIKDIKLN